MKRFCTDNDSFHHSLFSMTGTIVHCIVFIKANLHISDKRISIMTATSVTTMVFLITFE